MEPDEIVKVEETKPEDMTMIWTLAIICITIIAVAIIIAFALVRIFG